MITIGNHFRVWGVKLSEIHAFAITKLMWLCIIPLSLNVIYWIGTDHMGMIAHLSYYHQFWRVVFSLFTFLLAEKQEVCDTKDILQYLRREHGGDLDAMFANKTIDAILKKVKTRYDHHYHHKRSIDAMEQALNRYRRAPGGYEKKGNYDDKGNPLSYDNQVISSVFLFEFAHACRYGSIALLSCMFLIVSTVLSVVIMIFSHSKNSTCYFRQTLICVDSFYSNALNRFQGYCRCDIETFEASSP